MGYYNDWLVIFRQGIPVVFKYTPKWKKIANSQCKHNFIYKQQSATCFGYSIPIIRLNTEPAWFWRYIAKTYSLLLIIHKVVFGLWVCILLNLHDSLWFNGQDWVGSGLIKVLTSNLPYMTNKNPHENSHAATTTSLHETARYWQFCKTIFAHNLCSRWRYRD